MSTIIWLHLSDLHYGNPETGWDAEEIHEKLRVDLKRMEQNHGLQPDLIFFTGDLAFGNIKEDEGLSLEDQFAGAHEFLNIVRTTFDRDVPKENIFLVPGNHDVNRKLVTESQTEWLDKQNDEQKITEMIKQGDQSWEDYVRRLRNYRKFLEKLGFGHLLSDPTRMLYAVKRQVNGITLGIGGFNSAWSSCRPSQEEKGKLWLGAKWQSASIRSQLKDVDFSIALIHHPPNWFVQEEDKRFRTELQEVFQFCLHGHEHEEWVLELENGHTMISAEACYLGSDQKNGYNFVRLDFDTLVAEVWLREYKHTGGGGWVANLLPEKTDRDGKWKLTNTEWMGAIECSEDTERPKGHLGGTIIPTAKNKEVLLIEDDVNWQSILNRELRNVGYVVDPAYSKDEALLKIAYKEIEKYALIVLDPCLDKSSGILSGAIILELIMKSDFIPPVIIVSGHVDFAELKNKLSGFQAITRCFEKRNIDLGEFRAILTAPGEIRLRSKTKSVKEAEEHEEEQRQK